MREPEGVRRERESGREGGREGGRRPCCAMAPSIEQHSCDCLLFLDACALRFEVGRRYIHCVRCMGLATFSIDLSPPTLETRDAV